MRQALRLVVIAATMIMLAGAVPMQSQYHDQIRTQLGAVERALLEQGYEQTHDFYIDALANSDNDMYTVTLRDDIDYQVVSVCDVDCSDIDLRLFDESNNLINQDETEDDVPVILASPRWTGEFGIQVTMYACSNNPCYFGIGVFGRPR